MITDRKKTSDLSIRLGMLGEPGHLHPNNLGWIFEDYNIDLPDTQEDKFLNYFAELMGTYTILINQGYDNEYRFITKNSDGSWEIDDIPFSFSRMVFLKNIKESRITEKDITSMTSVTFLGSAIAEIFVKHYVSTIDDEFLKEAVSFVFNIFIHYNLKIINVDWFTKCLDTKFAKHERFNEIIELSNDIVELERVSYLDTMHLESFLTVNKNNNDLIANILRSFRVPFSYVKQMAAMGLYSEQ